MKYLLIIALLFTAVTPVAAQLGAPPAPWGVFPPPVQYAPLPLPPVPQIPTYGVPMPQPWSGFPPPTVPYVYPRRPEQWCTYQRAGNGAVLLYCW